MAYLSRAWSTPLSRFTNRHFASLVYSEEVCQAKTDKKPIVALESTIITHGMPYPKNLETAFQVEEVIREKGAIPATIAILKGQLTVGLSKTQLEYLAKAKGVIKASRRDMAPVMAKKMDGATTVAGTIIASELACIPVFVTGGIGGVHREGHNTMDVSADLTELGRSRTLVVCSGVKSILDIGRTLEYLETQGVTVCSFGDSQDFPAFYTTRSGFKAPYQASDATQAAKILYSSHKLQLSSGIVVAVPIPVEHAMDENKIEAAIKSALVDANKLGIQGKEVTPFLLAAVSKATGGESLAANIALIKNNARIGADIAVHFQKLRNAGDFDKDFNIGNTKTRKCKTDTKRQYHTCAETGGNSNVDNGDVLVVGGSNVDRTFRIIEGNVRQDGSTHPCKSEHCGGGVGRNIAEALWRMRNGRVRLLTTIGNDEDGNYLQNIAPGLILDGCVINNARTAKYAAVFDGKGECILGLGDMDIHDCISIDLVKKHLDKLKTAPLIVLDGNIPLSTMEYILKICNEYKKPVFFEPTDRRKAIKPLKGSFQISFASPNILELRAMANFINPHSKLDHQSEVEEICSLGAIVSNVVNHLIITRGSKGVMTMKRLKDAPTQLQVRSYSGEIINTIENVSGAGDCFASGYLHGVLLGLEEDSLISFGFQAARDALLSKETVPRKFDISKDFEGIKCTETWIHSF
nr:pseudouridine-metabolizing bifunctional protein C1861.05 [Danaus plexippus plexippus]